MRMTKLFETTDRTGAIIRVMRDRTGYIYPFGAYCCLVNYAYGYSFSVQEALSKVKG